MAVFFHIGLFHVVWTPKIVACILTAGSFLTVTNTLARVPSWGPGIAGSALILVALQPAFVIWSISGLENPLYVFLLSLLMAGVAKSLTAPKPSQWTAIFVGVVAAGVAATRPDGALYVPLVPIVFAVRAYLARDLRPWVGALASYGVTAATLLGVLAGFRWWYFHDVVPNTYYMRMRPVSFGSILWLLPDTVWKLRDLGEAIAGSRATTWLLVIVFAGTVVLVSIRQFPPILAVLAMFSASSGLAYLLLPLDWMGEYRFASPFFLFFYTYITALAWLLCGLTRRAQARRRWTFAIVVVLLVAGTLIHVARRSVAFAYNPTVPLAVVAEYYGHRYNRVAAALGLDSGSLLAPDLGGTLLYSNLVVFDLGGLCDRTVARTIGRDQRAFHDYIFGQVRPTFIHIHSAYWARLAFLDADERFGRDYVAIRVVPDLDVGDFVRRDVLRGSVDPLASILDGGSLPEQKLNAPPSRCRRRSCGGRIR